MWNDEAVGGFFEDLPVLAFILTGSLLIISTNMLVAEQRGDLDRMESLERTAERLVDIVMKALSDDSHDGISIDSVRLTDLSVLPLAPELSAASALKISITMIHPLREFMSEWSRGTPDVSMDSGWHSRLFNVNHGQCAVGVGEVVVAVFG